MRPAGAGSVPNQYPVTAGRGVARTGPAGTPLSGSRVVVSFRSQTPNLAAVASVTSRYPGTVRWTPFPNLPWPVARGSPLDSAVVNAFGGMNSSNRSPRGRACNTSRSPGSSRSRCGSSRLGRG
jgi:hypothetical protein